MPDKTSRTWAEISLKNIEHNYKELRSHLKPGVRFLGVVKANAYGHGDIEVASLLQSLGCDYLAVATAGEAVKLRKNAITLPILILGYTPPEFADTLLDYDITQAVSDLGTATAFSQAAAKAGKELKIHIKLDSGMGRLGFSCIGGQTEAEKILAVLKLPGLVPEGIFTHFAVSEIDDASYTRRQFSDFLSMVKALENASGVKFEIKHCANSGATLKYEDMQLDMVRPGIALYGCPPGDSLFGFDLRPAMELKSRVYAVRHMPAGTSISYGRTFVADSDRKIAVMPMGYADGLHRVLSNKLEVSIHGKRVRQVGNICMDMCMIDVTEIPDVLPGDIITVFGRDGETVLPVEEAAEKAGTISYEILSGLSPRVPRIYV